MPRSPHRSSTIVALGAAAALLAAAPALATEGPPLPQGPVLPAPMTPPTFAPPPTAPGALTPAAPAKTTRHRRLIRTVRLAPRRVRQGRRPTLRISLRSPSRLRIVITRSGGG